jgi:predicted Fe-Mo cluster-binding NifX family protein
MRIGVTSQNFRTITPHAGMTRKFFVYETQADGRFVEVDRLQLPKDEAMHHVSGFEAHPLDSLDVLIAGSAGEGFVRKLAVRGVNVVITAETDPVQAVEDFLRGKVKPAPAHDCDLHHHGHSHEHGHASI